MYPKLSNPPVYNAPRTVVATAAIGLPSDPRLIVLSPYDKSSIAAVEKAIQKSDLGLTPSNDGNVIRIPIPALNEERRKELVKVVHKFAEEGKIATRHARTHGREVLKKLTGVPEDDVKHAEKDLQKSHDEYIGKLDALLKAKEAEVMEV